MMEGGPGSRLALGAKHWHSLPDLSTYAIGKIMACAPSCPGDFLWSTIPAMEEKRVS
jgi:hypothetical protein